MDSLSPIYLCTIGHSMKKHALHLILKMATAQVVAMSVTLNSLPEGYSHPEGHNNQNITFTTAHKFLKLWLVSLSPES